MQWYYAKQGQRFGPVDEPELHRRARQGELAPGDLVWNPTLGDHWAKASSVEGLFATPPPITASTPPAVGATRVPGNTHNRDLMRMARESLRANWGLGVVVMLLYQIVTSGVPGFLPFVGLLVCLIIAGPMLVGFNRVFISLARRTKADVEQLFSGFNRFGTALGAYLLVSLFVVLWSLLLIIPGIIAGYAYAMTFLIIADDPSVTAIEAITKSKTMMRGRKWKLFCLSWRFFGWALLCILTLGIGYLWLGPYMQTAFAHFYDDVKPQ